MTICQQPKSRDRTTRQSRAWRLPTSIFVSFFYAFEFTRFKTVGQSTCWRFVREKKMSRDDKNKKGKNSTTTVTWDAARPITFKLRTFRFKKFKFRILIHFKLKTIKNDNNSNLRMFTWINCKMHFFTVMETWAHIIPRLVYISPWQTRFLCILIFFPDEHLQRQEH